MAKETKQRNPWESEESFTTHAKIDFLYYCLKLLSVEYENTASHKSPINHLIDIATGNDKKIVEDTTSKAIKIVEKIIKYKKYLRADYSGDASMLEKLKNIPN